MTSIATHYQHALDSISRACRVARQVQESSATITQAIKDDRSPVTVADYAVQAIISLDLKAMDKDALLVGEEQSDHLRQPDSRTLLASVLASVRSVHESVTEDEVLEALDGGGHDGSASSFWVLDPVDGTKGFLRRQQFAIALAHVEHGQVTFGALGCPCLPPPGITTFDRPDPHGFIFHATLGGGTWVRNATDTGEPGPVQLPDTTGHDVQQPIRVCGSVEDAHSSATDATRVVEAMGREAVSIRLDSQCKYAVVARGCADAYLRLPIPGRPYIEKTWDHAAGSLVATEAGAIVTDVAGLPLDFTRGRRLEHNCGVICAHAEVHADILDAVQELGLDTPGSPSRVQAPGEPSP